MKIYIQKSVMDYTCTHDVIAHIGEKHEIIQYDKYTELAKELFLDIWDNFNINYENYTQNLSRRNNLFFIKKWTNLFVEDNKDFTSFEIYKKLWYTVYNVKIWMNCNLWCKYCYLLNTTKFTPEIAIYGNIQEETLKFVENHKDKKMLLNLWEYTDTFMLDKITDLTVFFNNLTLQYPNILIESRTKLQNLTLKFDPNPNFILGFSVSINELDKFWKKEQVLSKLNYIQWLTKLGYSVSIKFDPIISLIWYDDDFFDIIKEMDLTKIHHFSIWCLRFSKWLWRVISQCGDVKTVHWNFQEIHWKFVNTNREHIYAFFISRMKAIWLHDYYLSMDPK